MSFLLNKGDCVGIAAPSSPFDKKLFYLGLERLKKLGFQVYYQKDIFAKEGYLAGTDPRRAKEFTKLALNKKIKAILFARGGYGFQRMIPHLEIQRLKGNRKPVIGFSDATPLLAFLRQKMGFPTLYGPVVTLLGKNPTRRTLQTFLWQLTQNKPLPPLKLEGYQILKKGKAKGKLVGGCLSLIQSSLATPYELDFKNAILFFEDTDEKVYAIDRMLTQLKNSGRLKGVKGILIGTLNPKKGETHSMEAMLKDVLKDFKGPIVFGFPAGHTSDFVSLPLGTFVSLDTHKGRLVFEEAFLK